MSFMTWPEKRPIRGENDVTLPWRCQLARGIADTVRFAMPEAPKQRRPLLKPSVLA